MKSLRLLTDLSLVIEPQGKNLQLEDAPRKCRAQIIDRIITIHTISRYLNKLRDILKEELFDFVNTK